MPPAPAVETTAVAMQRRLRCYLRHDCGQQSIRRRWRCCGGCDTTCATTAGSSQGDGGGDAAAAATPAAPQLRIAVQTMAVAMPAAPQLLAAVKATAVAMQRRLRCHLRHDCGPQSRPRRWRYGGGCDATCATTADRSRDDGGGDAAAAAVPVAPRLLAAVKTMAMAMLRWLRWHLRRKCWQQSRRRRWRCGGGCDATCATTVVSSQGDGGGDAAAAAMPAAS